MCFHNQCAHWWRKQTLKSAGRPENPQIFRPAQSLLFDEKTPQRIFIDLRQRAARKRRSVSGPRSFFLFDEKTPQRIFIDLRQRVARKRRSVSGPRSFFLFDEKTPQRIFIDRFRPAQSFFYALKDAAADFARLFSARML